MSEQETVTAPEVLTVDQAAKFLQISRAHVYTLINRGEISGHRVGKRLRFTKRQLLTWIEQQGQPSYFCRRTRALSCSRR